MSFVFCFYLLSINKNQHQYQVGDERGSGSSCESCESSESCESWESSESSESCESCEML